MENQENKMWFLITHSDKQKDGREELFFCKRTELPSWSSCTPGFGTLDELKEYSNLPNWKCSKCGGEVSLTYSCNDELEKHKMCFSCNHFRDQVEQLETNTNKFIINGEIYTAYPNNASAPFKGFGGRKFRIRIKATGEIRETNNLWSQGELPKIWARPDTAEFLNDNM